MKMMTMFPYFLYGATGLAFIATLIVCVSYFRKCFSTGYTTPVDAEAMGMQIRTCQAACILFTVVDWLLVSCQPKSICLAGYKALAVVCSQLGIAWIGYSFICILCGIIVVTKSRDAGIAAGLAKFRNSGFRMGALFMLFSFILNVQ